MSPTCIRRKQQAEEENRGRSELGMENTVTKVTTDKTENRKSEVATGKKTEFVDRKIENREEQKPKVR
ncbi:hypothetical protein LXL04_024050 [Taraxacum kok-saghyz]